MKELVVRFTELGGMEGIFSKGEESNLESAQDANTSTPPPQCATDAIEMLRSYERNSSSRHDILWTKSLFKKSSQISKYSFSP